MILDSQLIFAQQSPLITLITSLIIALSLGVLLLSGCWKKEAPKKSIRSKPKVKVPPKSSEFSVELSKSGNTPSRSISKADTNRKEKEPPKEPKAEAASPKEKKAVVEQQPASPEQKPGKMVTPLKSPNLEDSDKSLKPKQIKDEREKASKIKSAPKTDFKLKHNWTMADVDSDFVDSPNSADIKSTQRDRKGKPCDHKKLAKTQRD